MWKHASEKRSSLGAESPRQKAKLDFLINPTITDAPYIVINNVYAARMETRLTNGDSALYKKLECIKPNVARTETRLTNGDSALYKKLGCIVLVVIILDRSASRRAAVATPSAIHKAANVKEKN